jgi:Restriction endonuclease XhoI
MTLDFDTKFDEAIQGFWRIRAEQAKKRAAAGRTTEGNRGSVTGGQQMRMIEALIVDVLVDAGLTPDEVRTRKALELPGYYRPEKCWDLLVIADKKLVAAVEFKSQVGSFGNNFNNRTEEAIGNAEDLWIAWRNGLFGAPVPVAPFLGFFFLLEDCPRVHKPVRNAEAHYKVDSEFRGVHGKGISYAKRYELLFRRLLMQRKYSAACLTLATKPQAETTSSVSFPAPDIGLKRFVAALQGHVHTFVQSR